MDTAAGWFVLPRAWRSSDVYRSLRTAEARHVAEIILFDRPRFRDEERSFGTTSRSIEELETEHLFESATTARYQELERSHRATLARSGRTSSGRAGADECAVTEGGFPTPLLAP